MPQANGNLFPGYINIFPFLADGHALHIGKAIFNSDFQENMKNTYLG
jgi:hypothetical protein